MMRFKILTRHIPGVLAATASIHVALPALATQADWIAPVSEGLSEVTTGLVNIAGTLIGLCIVAFALWAAMTGRLDWSRLWIYILTGLIVTVGPTAIRWLIEITQKG